MWIRTQDKLGLTYNTNFRIGHLIEKDVETGKEEEFWVISCVDDLGKYKSKERAIEVLDEIEESIKNYELDKSWCSLTSDEIIYQMPEV